MLGLTIAAVQAANGCHFAVLSDEEKSGAIFYTLAGFPPGIFSFRIPKLAVAALVTRLNNPSRKHRIFLWAMTSGCLLILLGCVIIFFAQYTPSRSQWDFSVQGTCWSPWILIYYAVIAGSKFTATISAIVDLYLAMYPTVVLYGLQINLKKKIALNAALGLGSIAAAVAVYKSTRLPVLVSPDFEYDTADITVWTSIEGNSIIIDACIPTLQLLFDRIFGRGEFGSSRGEQGPSGYISRSRSGVKLAAIGNKTLRLAKQHGKSGVSETTLGHDSQDSILSLGLRNGSEESKVEPNSGITRTQHLTVECEDVTEQTRPSYSPCDTRRQK
ncbi:integral membrane protein [Alternaria rosae]|uniref:uncharacterized protein n=1 Tax=Alternaria rosae TaxID=1187941 RepID=UPI001E8D495A|nr:uncharacterized protein BKA58DRAFT_441908 [Alternaria rosae]KAH6866912.1 integral membrane protein [Alternaria rosae]